MLAFLQFGQLAYAQWLPQAHSSEGAGFGQLRFLF